MMRTSIGSSVLPPTRRTTRSCSARRSFTCIVTRGLADLVEEERSALRLLEEALLLLDGARERAALVAEELGLEEVLGHRAAVDRDERAGRARAEAWWIARATSSLPVPDSPVMRTVDVVLPMRRDEVEEGAHLPRDADDRRRPRTARRAP